jgi:N utilization substance protein B
LNRSEQRRAAVFACYQSEVTGTPIGQVVERGGISPVKDRAPEAGPERPEGPAGEFTRELAEGLAAHREELDALIAEHSIGWDLDRIAPLERCIMRTALFEVLHRSDVPREVAIDEAIETAKLYCGKDAPSFVNGILGSVVKTLDRQEGGG